MEQDTGNRTQPAPAAQRRSGSKPKNAKSPCAAELHQGYLKGLGERVRSARARRGMSRKILARDSHVSERYLAQLEAGRGNISIALLRQVAQAMSLPIEDLVREGGDMPIELVLLQRRLERLSTEQLSEANNMISSHFGMEGAVHRTKRVALTGLRGAGKTTLGKALALQMNVPFVELAQKIEASSGMSLDKIFDLSGQLAYRRYEKRALEQVLESHSEVVIATGGSLVSQPETYDLLLSACFTIWVKATPEEHMNRVVAQGDMRPMAGNSEAMEDLIRILADREQLYAKADAQIDTSDRSEADSVAMIGEYLANAQDQGDHA
jgi:XRE family transcriptional regulator, aerobic/anaerobic benzoate catabolism transcriptional regulator